MREGELYQELMPENELDNLKMAMGYKKKWQAQKHMNKVLQTQLSIVQIENNHLRLIAYEQSLSNTDLMRENAKLLEELEQLRYL